MPSKTRRTEKPARARTDAGGRNGSKPRNVLKPGIGREHGMPSQEDITYLESARLPPSDGRRSYRDLASAFTPEVCTALRKPEVAGFFGTRVETQALAALSERAAEAEAVRSRFEHAVQIAAQISTPLSADLFQGLSDFMRDWDVFSVRYPQAADRLMPLRDWWEATHPGGGRPSKPEPQPQSQPQPTTPKV